MNDNDDDAQDHEKQLSNLLTNSFKTNNQQEKNYIEQILRECFGILNIDYSKENLKKVKSIKRFDQEKIIEDFYLDYKTANEKLLSSLEKKGTSAGIYIGYSWTIHIKKQ